MARIVSFAEQRIADLNAGFLASARDVRDEAARRSRSSTIAGSGTVDQLGPGHLRVRFSAPFAKARERGAFIRPRRGRQGRNGRPAAIRFADGSFRTFARLRKQPYLAPAGAMWGEFLLARLRGSGVRASRRRR